MFLGIEDSKRSETTAGCDTVTPISLQRLDIMGVAYGRFDCNTVTRHRDEYRLIYHRNALLRWAESPAEVNGYYSPQQNRIGGFITI